MTKMLVCSLLSQDCFFLTKQLLNYCFIVIFCKQRNFSYLSNVQCLWRTGLSQLASPACSDTSNGCFSTKFSLRSNCSPNPAIKLVESNCVNMHILLQPCLAARVQAHRTNLFTLLVYDDACLARYWLLPV